MTREDKIELEVIKEIVKRIKKLGLEFNETNIKIVSNQMMDELNPLPSGKQRDIRYITGKY